MTFGPRQSLCPYCARPYNRHRTVEGQGAPEPGDVSICIGCGEVLIFNEGLRLRRPTQAERRDALADRKVTQLRRRVLARPQPVGGGRLFPPRR